MHRSILIGTILVLLLGSSYGQIATGGQYSLEKSAVAGGGGVSGNGQFSVTGTLSQSVGGNAQVGIGYGHQPGFWTRELIPTVGAVSISGRVTTASGAGVRNALVRVTNSSGFVRSCLTGPFGYYRIDDIEVGLTYIIAVSSKRFEFSDPVRTVNVTNDLTDVDFIAVQ